MTLPILSAWSALHSIPNTEPTQFGQSCFWSDMTTRLQKPPLTTYAHLPSSQSGIESNTPVPAMPSSTHPKSATFATSTWKYLSKATIPTLSRLNHLSYTATERGRIKKRLQGLVGTLTCSMSQKPGGCVEGKWEVGPVFNQVPG